MRIHKYVQVAAIIAAGAAVALPAFAGNIEARFGNTMLATRPSGTVMKLWYNKDHTFTGEFQPAGAPMTFQTSGTWRVDGDNICVQPDNPPGTTNETKAPESCALLKGDKVGDKWETTIKDIDGTSVVQTVEIIKGR
ncbi:MAG: hypothetical protein Q7T44_07060 [Parvibaculum sp.]|nr:hypothetical protein [Parvibaculum sp.]